MNLKILEALGNGKTGRELEEIKLVQSVNQKFALKIHFEAPLVSDDNIQIRFNGLPLEEYKMTGKKVSVRHLIKKDDEIYYYSLANISYLLSEGRLTEKNSLIVRATDNFGIMQVGMIFFVRTGKGYNIIKESA